MLKHLTMRSGLCFYIVRYLSKIELAYIDIYDKNSYRLDILESLAST